MVQQVHHPAFPQPENEDTSIWRYLTKTKFTWLVNEGRLFMPQAARLGDPLEGTQPKGDTNWWQTHIDNAKTPEQKSIIEHNRELISRFAVAFRTLYYVSCWHINEELNWEMWESYANESSSVAIRSTTGRLRGVLPVYVDIGMVRYINYAIDRLPTSNMLEYITHKSDYFASENELRAVAMHPIVDGLDQKHFQSHHFASEHDATFLVFAPPVNVTELISEVYLHPDSPQEFAEEIEEMCNKNGLPSVRRATW
jgi:hypothetical protein